MPEEGDVDSFLSTIRSSRINWYFLPYTRIIL